MTNRKGIVEITKYLYDGKDIDDVLFGLRMKVYKVVYEPFRDVYEVSFTSIFCRPVDEGTEVPMYSIVRTENGFTLKETGENSIPKQTDKQKEKIKEVLDKFDIYCSCKRSPGINNTTGNCIGCGRKYDKPWMRTRVVPNFQPCLLDNVPSGTITNVACSCPKCSPKC